MKIHVCRGIVVEMERGDLYLHILGLCHAEN